MAVSAAEYYEVRWRLQDSDEEWSAPQRVNPSSEIVVSELERDQSYDFEVRAVSNCGAKSVWVSGTHGVPAKDPNSLTLADIATEAQAASDDAAAATLALANIASDNVLSEGEKPLVIRDYSVITTEQAGIDAQATAYGITTEKTAYDGKASALTSYLATLTTPKLWSDLTGDTTIVGTTFRQAFADVYTTRQALLNAIYAAAKAKADAAQVSADTALGQVTQLPVINGGFDIAPTGYGWTADSGSGWVIDTAGNTPGVGPNSAKHVTGTATSVFRNHGLAACNPGQVYKTQCLVKAVGANGSCYIGISWCDANETEITTTPGTLITGTTTAGSTAIGTAPAGTVYVRTILVAINHTAGTYYVDNVVCSQYPSSVDEVPDGTTYLRSMQQSHAVGALTIDDATFQLPGVPGWFATGVAVPSIFSQFASPSPAIGGQYLVVSTAGDAGWAQSTRCYSCNPGDSVSVGGLLAALSGVFSTIQADFYTANDVYISSISASTSATGWTPVQASGLVPTTAAKMYLAVRCNTASKFVACNYIWCSVNDVRVAGSGATLGNQYNAPNSLTMTYGAAQSSTSLSATSTGAISVSAFTVYAGSVSATYNAVANAITGATVGTKYYVYCHDRGGLGGTKTWFAATSVQAAMQQGDDVVFAGSITIPSSGTGSGGGSDSCPVRAAWVIRKTADGREYCHAGDVAVGDEIQLTDGRWGYVSYSQAELQPCVRVVGQSGKSLSCSESAPLGLLSGSSIRAVDSADSIIHTSVGSDRIAAVDPLGQQWVQHITCENNYFWAGDQQDVLFSHHNLKP